MWGKKKKKESSKGKQNIPKTFIKVWDWHAVCLTFKIIWDWQG